MTRGEVKTRSIPIYTSRGDWLALMVFPYVYSSVGEWVGFLTPGRQVYDVDGLYVGWLTDEPRILRKRTYDQTPPPAAPPLPPARVRPPATVPLPRMMAELPFEIIDVLQEEPERLHTTDTGDLKQDME
jgi:hypothetical protein